MITYAKGASVLKQLVAWVGLEPFVEGLRQYFRDHAYGNSEFDDLLTALERSSGRELRSWAEEWLQTAGVNTLTPEFELDDDGAYRTLTVRQSAHPDYPTLRRHRLGIGMYDLVGPDSQQVLVRRDYIEVDVEGETTDIKEAVGQKQPDLLLLNENDLAYVKIRLDERSLATAVHDLSRLEDSLARALVWGACWDMCRDAEMTARDFVELVLSNIGSETDAWGVTRIPVFAAQAVNSFSAPPHRPELKLAWERGLRRLLDEAEPGSDQQLTFVRQYASAARTEEALADLEALLDGSQVVEGLDIDTDLRWKLLAGLAAAGRADGARIDAELASDNTISGQEHAAFARAAMPTAEAKDAAWQRAVLDPGTPNETARQITYSFMRPDQEEVLAPYLQRYLDAVETSWEVLGAHKAAVALEYIFPRPLASPELLETVDAFLETSTANPGALRFVREGRAEVARALAAQEYDAHAG
jgi:aminopeptidase N